LEDQGLRDFGSCKDKRTGEKREKKGSGSGRRGDGGILNRSPGHGNEREKVRRGLETGRATAKNRKKKTAFLNRHHGLWLSEGENPF